MKKLFLLLSVSMASINAEPKKPSSYAELLAYCNRLRIKRLELKEASDNKDKSFEGKLARHIFNPKKQIKDLRLAIAFCEAELNSSSN